MSKVVLTTAGHTIEIEQDGVSAKELSRLAYRLWRKTRDPKLNIATGTGFSASLDRTTEPGRVLE